MSKNSFSFSPFEPYLSGLDVHGGEIGRRAEILMHSPAYFDRNHPMHFAVLGEVSAAIDVLCEGRMAGQNQGHHFAFDALTGQPILHEGINPGATVATGALGDEHLYSDATSGGNQ